MATTGKITMDEVVTSFSSAEFGQELKGLSMSSNRVRSSSLRNKHNDGDERRELDNLDGTFATSAEPLADSPTPPSMALQLINKHGFLSYDNRPEFSGPP